MNGDVANKVATRSQDRLGFELPPKGHKYCWRCSTYKPAAAVAFGSRCWDCVHAPSRTGAAKTAVAFLHDRNPGAALLALAAAVDAQAAAEGLLVPAHHSVTRNAHRRILTLALQRTERAHTNLGALAARFARPWHITARAVTR